MAWLYSTARWVRKRERQLKANPLCKYCKRQGKLVPATVADHVIPHRKDEPLFWTGELQSLCKQCHDSTKKVEEATGKRAIGKGCDASGVPLDSEHWWGRG